MRHWSSDHYPVVKQQLKIFSLNQAAGILRSEENRVYPTFLQYTTPACAAHSSIEPASYRLRTRPDVRPPLDALY